MSDTLCTCINGPIHDIEGTCRKHYRPDAFGPMPIRTFRCPDELWDKAKAKAKENNSDLSVVIRRQLRRYVSG